VRARGGVIHPNPQYAGGGAGDGMIVHLKPLPGFVEDYQAVVERSLAS
jgi:hypothetical protein